MRTWVKVAVVALALGAGTARAEVGPDDGALRLPAPGLAVSLTAAADAEDTERIRRQVRQRRSMMQLHQALSVALVPVLGATAVMGTVNRVRIDQGLGVTPAMLGIHRGLAIGSAALYGTTGILAAAAPHPLRDRLQRDGGGGRDPSRLHRALAIAHLSVMAALLVTGIIDANAPLSPEAYSVLSKVHVIEGWTMFTLVMVAGFTISFG